jgi:hypothetical protein
VFTQPPPAPQIHLEDLYRPGFILVGFQFDHACGRYNSVRAYWLPEAGPYLFHWDFGRLDKIWALHPQPRKMSGLVLALNLLKRNELYAESVLLTPELLKPGRDRRQDYLKKQGRKAI